MDAYMGEIRAFAFGFAPVGWMPCYGQTMQISQYTALFSILTTRYGGDGKTTFNLPNLMGLTAIGCGTAATGTEYDLGEEGGEMAVTLITSEIANHTHTVNGANATSPIANTVSMPTNTTYISNPVVKTTATTGAIGRGYAPKGASPMVSLNPLVIGAAGSTQPHTNMMPYVTFTYCICLDGYYPPRPNN